jgi:V/A-type H+-transporting ATPase subunit E
LGQVRDDSDSYLQLLENLLARAAQAIERDQLLVELDPEDLARLAQRKGELEAAAGKQLELREHPQGLRGGLILHDSENRIRIDNSFEGRLERHLETIQQILLDHLFGDLRIERLQHET